MWSLGFGPRLQLHCWYLKVGCRREIMSILLPWQHLGASKQPVYRETAAGVGCTSRASLQASARLRSGSLTPLCDGPLLLCAALTLMIWVRFTWSPALLHLTPSSPGWRLTWGLLALPWCLNSLRSQENQLLGGPTKSVFNQLLKSVWTRKQTVAETNLLSSSQTLWPFMKQPTSF